ncbi:hypothetical protein CNMCM6805_000661 [Aspergillus fumigatiaffinis]|uniref:Uncharacterized protein n=1 Tax=Aspergillus fumigatiaffinis TaxID=340414 RepID=A0A8H4GY80_9EURO|nr:hypothetical protein CNMCM5878_002247 [Aspergillus fumigatiaffinis]KAF4230626.1 hypothetical protein CNMCM6805_000661 [Aspergillus fumigatiaffinis]
MSFYNEEYETATPLIASLLWSLPGERPDHVVKQLKELNTQIRAKNIQAKRRQNEGLINVELFLSLGDQLQEAATTVAGSDEERFLEYQETLQNAIEEFKWPEDWNIELDQFTEYCEALAKLGDNSSGTQDIASAPYDSDLGQSDSEASDMDELFDDNISNWQSATPFDDIRHEAEKEYGIPFTQGAVLGWSGSEESGYSLIVGSQHGGKKIARIIQSTNLPSHVDDNMSIELNSRAKQAINHETVYDSRLIEGIGLVAWKVNARHELDPTSSLHPGKVKPYPETYVWVLWYDGAWSWESRWGLQQIMQELTDFQVDLLIYRLATSQDADYRESLTGERPSYPTVSPSDIQGRGTGDAGDIELGSLPAKDSWGGTTVKKSKLCLDEPLLSPDMDRQSSASRTQSKRNSKSLAPHRRNGQGNKSTLPGSPHGASESSRYAGHRQRAELLGVVRSRLGRTVSRKVAWEDDF